MLSLQQSTTTSIFGLFNVGIIARVFVFGKVKARPLNLRARILFSRHHCDATNCCLKFKWSFKSLNLVCIQIIDSASFHLLFMLYLNGWLLCNLLLCSWKGVSNRYRNEQCLVLRMKLLTLNHFKSKVWMVGYSTRSVTQIIFL